MPFAEELLRDCLAAYPHVRLTVSGRCMEPAIRSGDKVHLVAAGRRPPRVGDVVLARQKEGLRLHRLVWGRPSPRPAPRGGRGRTAGASSTRRSPPGRARLGRGGREASRRAPAAAGTRARLARRRGLAARLRPGAPGGGAR